MLAKGTFDRLERLVRKVFLGIAMLLTTGCESMRVLPAGVSGNSEFVSISNVWNVGDALPYATKHCAQFGKVPKPTSSNPDT